MTIPERLWPTIHTFCSDMWDGYLSAAAEFIAAHPEVEARIVIDRFHVAQNYRADFDTLRKQELRRLRKNCPKKPTRRSPTACTGCCGTITPT